MVLHLLIQHRKVFGAEERVYFHGFTWPSWDCTLEWGTGDSPFRWLARATQAPPWILSWHTELCLVNARIQHILAWVDEVWGRSGINLKSCNINHLHYERRIKLHWNLTAKLKWFSLMISDSLLTEISNLQKVSCTWPASKAISEVTRLNPGRPSNLSILMWATPGFVKQTHYIKQ